MAIYIAKAYYCAKALTICELVWMNQLLQELQFGDLGKMTLLQSSRITDCL